MSKTSVPRLIGLFLLMKVSCCQIFAQEILDYAPCNEIPALMQEFTADYGALVRFYTPSTGSGGQAAGGRGTSNTGGSPERTGRLLKLYDGYLKRLGALDFNALPQECKVDYILFKRDLNDRLSRAKEEANAYERVKTWFPFSKRIYSYNKDRRRGLRPDAAQLAKDWNQATKEIESLTNKLKATEVLDKEDVDESLLVINDLRNAASSVYEFYNGYDPLFTWWVPATYTKLDSSMNNYARLFRQKTEKGKEVDKSGIVGNPVGRDELARQLQFEFIPYSPDELVDIANKEFAWCDAEMLRASREMGFGDDWHAALEKVKNTYVEPGEQPEMIYGLYKESIDFLKEHDLITVPPLAEEVWGMYMLSPEAQKVSPFFLGGTNIMISYPTNTMDYDDRMMSMRGNNPHFSRSTVHHELIAGHNLQGFMNARHRTYRNFRTPFWTEGWALYWELLLWDLNFPKGPEDRIGMLFWHMHRCARIIFSLNYHLGKWTPQQCIDFLVDRVGFERANAEGEVRRSFIGSYPPLYQLAYLTGGRQFYALHKELVGGGKMTDKAFHDKVISLNAMPVEMVRAILTDQKLNKDFKTNWRFYDGK
ncbi:DUF885 family protein [Olivibacter sitiensis]|uniref:DUF885 family protein n=1 Tax=Olivibacter sitiensis TaxID=376470 RepID=UPI00040C0820|nr:DUF885 family protein [Olivibacter sitiensis]